MNEHDLILRIGRHVAHLQRTAGFTAAANDITRDLDTFKTTRTTTNPRLDADTAIQLNRKPQPKPTAFRRLLTWMQSLTGPLD